MYLMREKFFETFQFCFPRAIRSDFFLFFNLLDKKIRFLTKYFFQLCLAVSELIKQKFVYPSIVHLWLRLSLNLLHGFLSNFRCCFSGPCAQPFFLLKNAFSIVYDFASIFINMGHNGSEHIKMLLLLQIATESFQAFPEFLPNVPRKLLLGFLKF